MSDDLCAAAVAAPVVRAWICVINRSNLGMGGSPLLVSRDDLSKCP